MSKISLTVNGRSISKEVSDNTLLVEFIRENLRLTGTHVGCDTSQCGACTVHVDGKSVKSCTMLAVEADGADVTTIEGIANGDINVFVCLVLVRATVGDDLGPGQGDVDADVIEIALVVMLVRRLDHDMTTHHVIGKPLQLFRFLAHLGFDRFEAETRVGAR